MAAEQVLLEPDMVDAVDALIRAAGSIALSEFRRPLTVENKSQVGFDPVTEIDRAVERFIRRELKTLRPDDQVVGEEDGASGEATTGWVWTIDPIDGTRSYVTGSPLWGVLVALQIDGQPVAGWFFQPHTGELFRGCNGTATLEHNSQVTVLTTSQTADLSGAALFCTDPIYFQDPADRAAYERLTSVVQLRRLGGDCYSYGQLALGFVDLVVDGSLQPYDILPLIPIIEAAGGVVSTFTGESPFEGGSIIAAANRTIHEQALNVMRGTK